MPSAPPTCQCSAIFAPFAIGTFGECRVEGKQSQIVQEEETIQNGGLRLGRDKSQGGQMEDAKVPGN
jgi:hypothetical protein